MLHDLIRPEGVNDPLGFPAIRSGEKINYSADMGILLSWLDAWAP